MNLPPPVLDSSRVLRYAVVDNSVNFTNRIKLNVAGEWLGKVPRLAISKNYVVPDDYLLLFCGESWEVLGVISGENIEMLMAKAERGYEGIKNLWIEHPASDEQVAEYLENEYGVDPNSEWWKCICSFCGKDQTEVGGMFEGKRSTICHECVRWLSSELGNTSGYG
ncbi:MAG: ClpX C4-type zinc finger protein [Rhodanobacteraceae bacterium]|nr:ClpX C4-type zinc finger protein [Rhodanobacteraceae bacterium]